MWVTVQHLLSVCIMFAEHRIISSFLKICCVLWMVVKVFQFVIDHVRESHAEIKTSSSDLEHVVVLVLTQRQPCWCQHVCCCFWQYCLWMGDAVSWLCMCSVRLCLWNYVLHNGSGSKGFEDHIHLFLCMISFVLLLACYALIESW